MPRDRRVWVPGLAAHTISRFVDRRFFMADQEARDYLLDSIGRAQARWDWDWLSWALMSSHSHYGNLAGEANPDRFFQSVHCRFAGHVHARLEGASLGPVYASRPTIHTVRTKGLGRMVAYHHRNPDEAGVTTRPRESRWTSHRVYLRLDPSPWWFDVEWALDLLGFQDTEAGRRRFDDFVNDVDLTEPFWEPPAVGEPGTVVRQEAPPVTWKRLVQEARTLLDVGPATPIGSRRGPATRVRWLVAKVAVEDLGQPYSAVGAALEMRATSVFNLLARYEEDPQLQAASVELRRRLVAA